MSTSSTAAPAASSGASAAAVSSPDSEVMRAVRDIVGGFSRGIAQVVVGHPLDTVKVRLQSQSRATAQYRGVWHCIATTLREEGAAGFYKGSASPLAAAAAYSAVLFLAYGQAKRLVAWATLPAERRGEPLDMPRLLLVGCATGVAAASVEGPMDLIKTKVQVQRRSHRPLYRNSLDCVQTLLRERGVRALYQGIEGTLWRNVPGSAIYFASYEYCKQLCADRWGMSHTAAVLTAGGVGGIVFWTAIYPIDVAKTNLQTDHSDPARRLYRGLWHCLTHIWRTDGMHGLWRGFLPCLIRAAPVNAASFLAYEYTKKLLGE